MKVILVALCLIVVSLGESEGLSCLPCYEVKCEAPIGCKWGTQRGVCGCCEVCKKGEGERCGGPWNIYGKCADGLTCLQSGPYGETYCADESDNEIERKKRHLFNSRRPGLAQKQPRVHRHQEFGGVPEHIKQRLRAQGIEI